MPQQQPEIELHNISKIYRIGDMTQAALSEVSLQIHAGELFSIMGASGSGKTTLMNMLGLLDQPTSGKYLLKGRDVTTLSEDERAQVRNQSIGFVFQQFFLLPRLTVLQNVGLPLQYRRVAEAEIQERALKILDKMGLKNHAHHKPNQLSGGQQQRAAIARALIGNPVMILADEPTGSLDTTTGQMIMDLFVELNQKDHVTVVVVTHDPGIAAQCRRGVKIKDGIIL
jgi:putative ABC transport system ATP-binding protein